MLFTYKFLLFLHGSSILCDFKLLLSHFDTSSLQYLFFSIYIFLVIGPINMLMVVFFFEPAKENIR